MIIPVLRDFFFPSEYSLLFSQMPPELPEKERHNLQQTKYGKISLNEESECD